MGARDRFNKSELKQLDDSPIEMRRPEPRSSSQLADMQEAYKTTAPRGLSKQLSWASKSPFLGLRNLPDTRKREEAARSIQVGPNMASVVGRHMGARMDYRFRGSKNLRQSKDKRKILAPLRDSYDTNFTVATRKRTTE